MPVLLTAPPATVSNAWLEFNFLLVVAGLIVLNLLLRSG